MTQAPILDAPILRISWLELAASGGLVLMAVGLSRRFRTGLAGSFLVGALRTVVQLTLVGYVLVYIFSVDRWWLVLAGLALMTGVATREAVQRQDSPPRSLYGITGLALALGAGLTLVYVSSVVVRPESWYSPRYLIPLFGMIISSAMNAAALAAERLTGEMESRSREVEARLALGADEVEASREPVRRAIRAASIPIMNQLMIVGVVALPGMMTGQILSGTSPLTAVRYQIVVMFMLAAAVAVSAVVVAAWYRREFFSDALQFRPPGRA